MRVADQGAARFSPGYRRHRRRRPLPRRAGQLTSVRSFPWEEQGMVQSEQLTVDHVDTDLVFGAATERMGGDAFGKHDAEPDEQAAREALRTQVAKLERELSGLVAHTFPHISPRDEGAEAFSGPRLLSLAELERLRDRLVLRVGEVRVQVAERTVLEQRSRALLQ